MNNLIKGSLTLLLFSLSIAIFQISCKKEAIARPGNPLTKEEILVEKTWKVDKLHHVLNCAYSEYTDGGTNTTGVPYENLRFKFNQDGTGLHTNQTGSNYNFTWSLSTDQRTLSIIMDFGGPAAYTWEMVEISDGYLHASTNLTVAGNADNVETFRLIQIP